MTEYAPIGELLAANRLFLTDADSETDVAALRDFLDSVDVMVKGKNAQ